MRALKKFWHWFPPRRLYAMAKLWLLFRRLESEGVPEVPDEVFRKAADKYRANRLP